MNAQAQQALTIIQVCVASGRYRVLAHFTRRMDDRGLFWPDVECVIASPSHVHDGGSDEFGRPKWILTGKATDGLALQVVCVLDADDRGHVTVFITVHWK